MVPFTKIEDYQSSPISFFGKVCISWRSWMLTPGSDSDAMPLPFMWERQSPCVLGFWGLPLLWEQATVLPDCGPTQHYAGTDGGQQAVTMSRLRTTTKNNHAHPHVWHLLEHNEIQWRVKMEGGSCNSQPTDLMSTKRTIKMWFIPKTVLDAVTTHGVLDPQLTDVTGSISFFYLI